MSDASKNLRWETKIIFPLTYYILILALIYSPRLWHYRLAGVISFPVLPILALLLVGVAITATLRSKIDKSYPKFVGRIWLVSIVFIPAIMWSLDITFVKCLQHLALCIPFFTRVIHYKNNEYERFWFSPWPTISVLLIPAALGLSLLLHPGFFFRDAVGPCHIFSAAKWSGCQYSIRKTNHNINTFSLIDPANGDEAILRPYNSVLWIEPPSQWKRLFTNRQIKFDHSIGWVYAFDDGKALAAMSEYRFFSFGQYILWGGISQANLSTDQVVKTIHPDIDDLTYLQEYSTIWHEFETREVYSTDPDEIFYSNESDDIAIKFFDNSVKIWRHLNQNDQRLNVPQLKRLAQLELDATYSELNPLPSEIILPNATPYWELPKGKTYRCITFSADARFLAALTNESLEIFDLETKSKIQTIQMNVKGNCPKYSNDFTLAAYVNESTHKPNRVKIINIETGKEIQELNLNNFSLRWISSFSPDNNRLYIDADDNHYGQFLSGSWTLVFKID